MTRGRLVLSLLLLGVAGIGVGALPWLRITVPTVIARQDVDVSGTDAVPVLTAVCLAVLAAGLATAIGGVWLRRVAGVAAVVLGVLVAASSIALLLDPEPAALTVAGEVSGVAQIEGAVATTPWPYVAIVLGLAIAAAGVLVTLSRASSAASRRFERDAAAAAPGPEARGQADPRVQAMDDWDALGRGEDPTAGSAG